LKAAPLSPLGSDAVPPEEPQGVEQEGEAGAALLVGQDLRIGQPGMVVDGQVEELPADPPALALAGAVTCDAVSVRSKRPSFLMSMWISSPRR
jgi:hypothetical protein